MHLLIKSKNNIRASAKCYRKNLTDAQKQTFDAAITATVLQLDEFKACKTLFTYYSTAFEINTVEIILKALERGKKVAVPRCINNQEMTFHYIKSLNDLQKGYFSLMEPTENAPVASDYSSSLMLVPALSADMFGYRVGYGKGYYDRYLSHYNGTTAVLCYSRNMYLKIPHSKYDLPCDFLVTENGRIKSFLLRRKN